jgi:CDP-diacylglycerol--serine O-phosphatidyltransferase
MKKPKMFAVLPTLLTLGNVACGFGAITFAAKVGPMSLGSNDLVTAALLIFLAMLFDVLDGSAARWTKQVSDFGAQLDSLCDAISFGVAPAFLMLQFVRHNHAPEGLAVEFFTYNQRLLWVIAALFVVCALLRLARFNVETDEDDSHDEFSGLPSPAAAGMVASFPLAMGGLYELAAEPQAASQQLAMWLIPAVHLLVPLLTFGVACCMVSRIRYPHVFNQLLRGQRSRQHVIQLVFTMAVVFLVQEMALPLIFCFFAFASPLRALWREVIARRLYKSQRI